MTSDRKQQILDEATRLFAGQGFEGMTMKQLAAACGITEPALYRHFASKDALYDHVLDTIGEGLDSDQFLKSIDTDISLEPLLYALAHHIIDFCNNHAETYRLLLFSALDGHAKARQVFLVLRGSYVKFLAQHLDRLHEDGCVVRMNNEVTARCFIGMVFDCAMAATLWRGFLGKVFRPEETIANNVPIYVRGMTTPTSGKRTDTR